MRRSPLFLVLLLVFALAPARGGAASLTSGPLFEVNNGTNVTIRWTTDVPTGSRVQYGLNAQSLDQRAEGDVSTNHAVTITGLKVGSRYTYTVGTARVPLATNSFFTPKPRGATGDSDSSTRPTLARPSTPHAEPSPSPALDPKRKAPPTRQTWGSMASLQDHFDRHGADFKAKDPDDYARQAWEFLQRAKAEGLPAKVDDDGVTRVFDPKTRAFAAYNRDGTTKTYFKPNSRDYFERQPGKLVKLKP